MGAVETLRDALFGNPPSPTTEPSREGTLAAFTELYNEAVLAASVAAQGITTVANLAARDAFYATPANQTKLVYVNNNNGVPDDPANGVYEYVSGAPRIAEGFYQGVAAIVQPLVDAAAASAEAAEVTAENMDDLLDVATAGMEFIGATENPIIAGDPRPLIGALAARDASDFIYALMAFVQSTNTVDIVSDPLRRYVSTLAVAWPDYLQFIVHGQSLAAGIDSLTSDGTAVTTTDQGWGSRRFIRGGRTWSGTDWPLTPENRSGMDSLTALTGEVASGGYGEQIGNGWCDAFKARIVGRYGVTDADALAPHDAFTSAVRGSLRLTAVTSEDTGNETYSTSSTSVTIANGSRTFTVGTGLTLPNGTIVRMANAATGTTYDYSPYILGPVTSYNSGTGQLVINATEVSTGGLVTYDDWRLIRDGASGPGNYWNTMLADVQAFADLAASEGKSHAVGGFLNMQGERNADLKIYEYDAATVSMSAAIASYKTKFVDYAEEVQAEIVAITGQRSVPFLTYQTLSNPAAQAQLETAIENPGLITMVGPHYAIPFAWNGSRGSGIDQRWGDVIHMAADGSRMYGEQVAKVRWQIETGERFEPVRPLSAVKVDATHFDVTFHVPRPPLVIDTDFLAKAAGFGFVVYPGSVDSLGTAVAIADAEIIAPNVVRFTTATNIPANGKIWSGTSVYCDLGANPAITAVGDGADTPHGFDTKTITVAGDQRPLLASLSNEGAFTAAKLGATATRATIRSVEFTGGNTVLTYEVRESNGTFAPADQLVFGRAQVFTNLRDSDPTASIYAFADDGYPARLGQPYPLWNWCALFAAFPIEGA